MKKSTVDSGTIESVQNGSPRGASSGNDFCLSCINRAIKILEAWQKAE